MQLCGSFSFVVSTHTHTATGKSDAPQILSNILDQCAKDSKVDGNKENFGLEFTMRDCFSTQLPRSNQGIDSVQYSTVQCSAVQCSAVQCSAVQCSAVQHSTAQYSTVQHSTVQCSAVQCSAVQCSTVQCTEQCTVQCTLQYSAVQCTEQCTGQCTGQCSAGERACSACKA